MSVEWFTGPSLAIGIVVVVITGGLIAAGVRYLEARNRRDEEAVRLEQAFTGPLAHEPALAGSSVRPVASISMRGRLRVELHGWVSSAELRNIAIRTVEREAARVGQRVRITNHLEVIRRNGSHRQSG
jgi:hypothetical protein